MLSSFFLPREHGIHLPMNKLQESREGARECPTTSLLHVRTPLSVPSFVGLVSSGCLGASQVSDDKIGGAEEMGDVHTFVFDHLHKQLCVDGRVDVVVQVGAVWGESLELGAQLVQQQLQLVGVPVVVQPRNEGVPESAPNNGVNAVFKCRWWW